MISVLIVLIVVLLAITGYFIYKDHHKSGYLIIKQWGVEIKLTKPIDNATYKLVNNKEFSVQEAYLSNSTLDASAACVKYNSPSSIPRSDWTPSSQWIVRFSPDQNVVLYEGQLVQGVQSTTAKQAAIQFPSTYKEIGNYVYTFDHGNGDPCPEQPPSLIPDLSNAFLTISPLN
jgi:hypothetical protein